MPEEKTVALPFRAEPARSGPLTWSQKGALNTLHWSNNTLARVIPLETGPIDDVLSALRLLVERHEALRSRVVRDDSGVPYQETIGEGVVTVVIRERDADTDTESSVAAYAVADRLRPQAGELTTAPSACFGIITAGEAPQHLALVLSHFFADDKALDIVAEELASLLAGSELLPQPPGTWRPIDQALFESSPAGQHMNSRALDYWERLLSNGRQALFPRPLDGDGPPTFSLTTLESRSLGRAVLSLARDHNQTPMTVVLTLMSLALRELIGASDLMFTLIASNRWQPETARAVSLLAQNALFHVELSGEDLAEALQRVSRAALLAHRHARHDPQTIEELRDRVSETRGADYDYSCFLNYRAALGAPSDADRLPALDSEATSPGLIKRGLSFESDAGTKLFLSAVGDTARFELQLWVHESYVSLDQAKDLLRRIESLAFAAAAPGAQKVVAADQEA